MSAQDNTWRLTNATQLRPIASPSSISGAGMAGQTESSKNDFSEQWPITSDGKPAGSKLYR